MGKTLVKPDENAHEGYLLTHRMWKAGKKGKKEWFYPAADGAHVRLFWDKAGRPCLEYSDGGSNTSSMARGGSKLDHYAYGIEQMEEKFGEDFQVKVVYQIFMAMRTWTRSTWVSYVD